MNGKIVVMTGATGGIGRVVCRYLTSEGYCIFAGCRKTSKIDFAGESDIEFIPLDLMSFASVRFFCDTVIDKLGGRKIDIIINNAGMIARKREATEDGYESSMQTNYLSAKLITDKLLPYINENGGKIINTLSCTISKGMYIEPQPLRPEGSGNENTVESLQDYSNSKFMLARYTVELHKAIGNKIMVCGVDPGIVNTGIITMHRWYDPLANLFFRPFIKSAEKGAEPLINAIRYTRTDNKKAYNASGKPLLFKGNRIRELSIK